MNQTQISQFVRSIRQKLPTYGTPEQCAEELKKEYLMILSPLPQEVIDHIDKACSIVKEQIEDVEILRRSSIIKPREDWYQGPSAQDRHWPALESYLREKKGWADEAVDSIDETSSEVVSLLANPGKEQFCSRGLVVGYVQSGKTANMTAVIAKAVDSGYNLIVLLGGMTNKLRAQTQRRLLSDIVDRHRHLWQLYTTAEDDGDFVVPRNQQFTMPVQGRAQLAVMKKITSRLNAFHKTIRETPPTILRELKVLLIDDECDQASVNSSREDYDITKINGAIRKIIRDLPAVTYVGYTATPFANVFINPYPNNGEDLDDLYPEDFITALPRPEEYFGTREVFGVDPVDAGDETEVESGRDMIHLIPDSEVDLLRPRRASDRSEFSPLITKSLVEAILWFVAASSIRRERGHEKSHMTMLVHSSPHIVQHERMADAIGDWIARNEGSLRAGSGEAFDHLRKVAERELDRVPAIKDAHQIRPKMDDVKEQIGEVLDELRIAVENGESERRLDYEGDPKTYIVVGGAVLARGLTLEGLCVSFFLRTAKQYDTLLQMGRWFGYRIGYEDLPRLWTTSDLASSFRALAHVEEEIREDIAVYRERNTTPQEFAVKVRAIPGMAITSATKMKHAYRTSISYEGRHVQTIRFDHLNQNVVNENWIAGTKLVDSIGADRFGPANGGRLASGVDASTIRKFLTSYQICSEHMDLKKDHLLGFIDSASNRMPEWNVGLIEPGKGDRSEYPLGGLGRVKMVSRSKLRTDRDEASRSVEEKTFADIKALMSKSDILIDAETRPESLKGLGWFELKINRPEVPLLLLYPINAESKPVRKSNTRTELNAVGDLLGVGIVFPGELNRSGDYYEVNLEAPTPEQLDEEEAEEDVDQPELVGNGDE